MFRQRVSDSESEEGAKDLSMKKKDDLENKDDNKDTLESKLSDDATNEDSTHIQNKEEEKPLINPFLLYYLKVCTI